MRARAAGLRAGALGRRAIALRHGGHTVSGGWATPVAAARRRYASAADAQRQDLGSMTVPQLKQRMKQLGIPNGKKKKAEIIDAILEHQSKVGGSARQPALHSGAGEVQPRSLDAEPTSLPYPEEQLAQKVRSGTVDVLEVLGSVERGVQWQQARPSAPPAARPTGPRQPALSSAAPTAAADPGFRPSTDADLAPGIVAEALGVAPVVIFSKTFCPHCKEVRAPLPTAAQPLHRAVTTEPSPAGARPGRLR